MIFNEFHCRIQLWLTDEENVMENSTLVTTKAQHIYIAFAWNCLKIYEI